ncbi:MAG: excinuclease ABC subunit C [Lentimicrobiaceae bacterium]|nr:excinuclease ABC subunit C [Lentimicrobiaceae bacterium]
MISDKIKSILKTIPTDPGVYRYYDDKGEIIYVGKAKNLKRRVHSYFNKQQQSRKVSVLVSRIADIRFTVVNSEMEALLLENNFIKQYKPRYNILLKDDKTYPWICIKNERFPRVFLTRKKVNDGSTYLGPYPSVMTAKTLLEMLRQLYPIRNCKLILKEENIKNNHYRPCLEYHIGNCKAPCNGSIGEDDYNEMIYNVKKVIKGNIQEVLCDMKSQMMAHAAKLEFEQAQVIKDKYDLLENYHAKSVVCSNTAYDMEVFSFEDAGNSFYVNYMKIVEGAIIQSHSLEIKRKLEESPEELLSIAIVEIHQMNSDEETDAFDASLHEDCKDTLNVSIDTEADALNVSTIMQNAESKINRNIKEIIVPIELSINIEGVRFTIPQRGEKREILELSQRNAKQYRLEVEKLRTLVDPERHTKRILNQMKEDLKLPVLPEVIECFDNSNFQGDYAVAAMTQFVNAKPNKSGYRHFNIKTVEGPNDFASMEEIIYRRYSRLLNENQRLPDLIVVDGGKGQLSSAVKILQQLGLFGKISIIGIAEKLEEIYFPGDSIPLYIDKRSETLKVIQHIRDEAHRFGITHHRKKFEKGFIHSELNDIKGVGKQTAEKLMLELKSVKNIKEASLETLEKIVGKAKAKVVWDYFQNN